MGVIDWTVITVYLAGMIGLSVHLGRGQEDNEDYYVGGRQLPWWAVGISVIATQSSAISFVSIPAFVGLREGGGLTWLQYELAVPLAMIFTMIVLVPYFRGLELVSVFEFLDRRFGPGTSKLLSVIFLLSRGFGTGVGVYAAAMVLSAMMKTPVAVTIVIIGVAAIIYDTIGGIAAVVWSDVIQLGLIVVGALLCIGYAVAESGGVARALSSFDPHRLVAFDPSVGVAGETTPFWAFLVGGFFLYAAYYGTDQSQVQRVLCTPSAEEASRSLVLNGLARLPLTGLYVALGVAIGAAYAVSPELQGAVGDGPIDSVVPEFIVLFLPAGIRGILLAAILAAAMSSLDSAINSLSAVTMRDYIEPRFTLSSHQQLTVGKVTTVVWGVLVTAFAFAAGGIDKTVIEAINKVGSAFYGPVLATFVLGVLTRFVGGGPMIAGVLTGVGLNLVLWVFADSVHWMWWNAIGFAVTAALAIGLAQLFPNRRPNTVPTLTDVVGSPRFERAYGVLLVYFLVILFLVLATYVVFA
ncbi:MAG: sodium/solute symporter [Myxococcota bacterium]